MRKKLTKIFWNIEVWAVQNHVNLVDLVKSFPTTILLQNLASIQKRTSPVKFAHLAEKTENGSVSNLSAKECAACCCAANDAACACGGAAAFCIASEKNPQRKGLEPWKPLSDGSVPILAFLQSMPYISMYRLQGLKVAGFPNGTTKN